MKPITTWYYKLQNGDYSYSHFTYGHTDHNKTNLLHKNYYLDIDRKINLVTE